MGIFTSRNGRRGHLDLCSYQEPEKLENINILFLSFSKKSENDKVVKIYWTKREDRNPESQT